MLPKHIAGFSLTQALSLQDVIIHWDRGADSSLRLVVMTAAWSVTCSIKSDGCEIRRNSKTVVGYITEHVSVSSVSRVTPSGSGDGAYMAGHALRQDLEHFFAHGVPCFPDSRPWSKPSEDGCSMSVNQTNIWSHSCPKWLMFGIRPSPSPRHPTVYEI